MGFNFTTSKKTIRTIKAGDKHFKIQNGFMLSDRACIDISASCPTHVASLIVDAYNRGWVSAVANVTEKEYMLIGLTNE